MAAPTYTWEFVCDLWGQRVPKLVTLEADDNLETKVGTLLVMTGGQVVEAGALACEIVGIAAEATSAELDDADPISLYLIAPGMVIRGTADGDATTLAGFNGKTIDLNANGSLDIDDGTGGCLSVYRVLNAAGTSVDCVITSGAFIEA